MFKAPGETTLNVRLVRIGKDVLPVVGNDETGWSLHHGDLYPEPPVRYRYRSLDELVFALVNLKLSQDGRA